MFKKILCCLIYFSCTQVGAVETNAYVGIDVQNCHLHFDHNFGGNLLKKDMQGISPFLGIKLNSFLSIEGGYQYLTSTKAATLPAGSYGAGTYIYHLISPITFKSTATFRSPFIDLIASAPLFPMAPIQFFGGIGISHTTALFTRRTMQFDGCVGTTKRKMEISRGIPRLMVGANYFVTRDFCMRFLFLAMNTKKLHAFANDGHHPAKFWPEIKPKNSICYSLGIRWSF